MGASLIRTAKLFCFHKEGNSTFVSLLFRSGFAVGTFMLFYMLLYHSFHINTHARTFSPMLTQFILRNDFHCQWQGAEDNDKKSLNYLPKLHTRTRSNYFIDFSHFPLVVELLAILSTRLDFTRLLETENLSSFNSVKLSCKGKGRKIF